MLPAFSAGPAALGYLYQARYALFLLLSSEEEADLSIEHFDDVAFEDDGRPCELLQLKHHVSHSGALTDASPDLWRSLRVWCASFCAGKLVLPQTLLAIVTTAKASDNSIAALLRPDSQRNPELAHHRLVEVATNSENQALADAFSNFLALPERERQMLVSKIRILDTSSNIVDVSECTKKRLEIAVRRQHLNGLHERLEGWWFAKVIRHLLGSSTEPISRYELLDKIRDISEQFRPDSLPIDFFDSEPPDLPDVETDERLFVIQLREIALQSRRIENAIRDYYRAFQQRSRWVREELLVGEELERYERRLVEEWERFYLAVQDRLHHDEIDEEALRQCGRTVFDWMELTANIPIRERVTESYVMRGSYHLLADKQPPKVWWHPKFMERLMTLVGIREASFQ